MELISFLASVSLRSLALATAAWGAMTLCRVKSPAARHAVWTMVMAGMLALAITGALLPTMPLRVLPPKAKPPIPMAILAPVPPSPVPRPAPRRQFPWEAIYAVGCLAFTARLAYGYFLTRRLVRAGRLVEPGVYESPCISVPLTVGWLRPGVLLPTGWDAWEPEKLQAVLVHERNHIRRADWAIAVLAGVNRCVFWFHPLAWWLEARLKTLAELACDDASLPHVASPECYARVLIEMAAAIRPGEGRVGWEAMAMAKRTEVRMRVERILDESRQIFPALTQGRWLAMALCALPLIYLAAVARPARVSAQDPPPIPAPAPEEQPAADRDLEAARARLAELEAQISRFKAQNMGRLPEQFQANVAQLNSYQMALGNANENMARVQQEKAMLETQLQNLNSQRNYYATRETSNEKLYYLNRRIQDLQSELQQANEVSTPNHPNIKRLQAAISSLERERETERAQDPPNQKMLLDLDGSIALLKTQIQALNLSMDQKVKQVQELNRIVGQYQARIESSPSLEMQYAGLVRNYELARQQMAELSQRHSGPATGPRLISRRDPEYTPEARKAGLQGKVELSVTIGPDGVPRDIQVTHGLGAGLDQKAIDCVSSWRFHPASRNGEPVAAFVVVEVPFRLQ